MAQGALDGLRLLDIGSPTGSRCGQWLAAHGAEVVGVTLNLDDPRGQELLKRLVKKSDILLDSLPPGALDRRDLGWEILSAENPGLILIRLSGSGADPAQACTAALMALHHRHRTGAGQMIDMMAFGGQLVANTTPEPIREIYGRLLGLSDEDLRGLASEGVI